MDVSPDSVSERKSVMKISRAFSLLLLFVAVSVAGYLYWGHKRAEESEHRAYVEKGKEVQAVVATMTSRWNAIADWQDGFKGRRPSAIYTSDVEKAILGERPILLYAHLDDIKTAGDGYTVELSSPVTQWFLHMRYRLLCNSAVAQRFIGEKATEFPIFAVVAHIDHVDKKNEPDNSYYLAEGTAKEAILVGVRGLGLAQSRVSASTSGINAAKEIFE
jgi:hypothetical protein